MGVLCSGSFSSDTFCLLFSIYLKFIHSLKTWAQVLSLPPSQGTSCCLTCRIISWLFLQHRTSEDFGRWSCYYESYECWYWELAVTLCSGQPPEERRPGFFWNSGRNWSCLLHPGRVLQEMDYYLSREGGTTRNSRQQILLLLCLVWSWSQQGQSEMFTQAPTLGTHRKRPLAGLQQERVAKFKALTSTKMGLRPKRRMNFLLWGSSGYPGVRLLNWAPKNKGDRYI